MGQAGSPRTALAVLRHDIEQSTPLTDYYRMMRQCESQRMKGWFFLPEDPDTRVPGILTWEPGNGATLELIGGLSPGPVYHQNPSGGVYADQIVGDVRPGTIYCETDSGNLLSIWDAQRGNYSASMFSQVREEFWSSSWVCVGAHIRDPQQAQFSDATVALDDLYYLTNDERFLPPPWIRIEGVERPGEELDNGTRLLPYAMPVIGGYRSDLHVAETELARYSVNTKATHPWPSEATEAMPHLKLDMMRSRHRRGPVIELEVNASVRVRPRQADAWAAADFVDHLTPLTDLLRLATFDACGVDAIALKTIDSETVSLLSFLGEPASPEETYSPARTVFTFADVAFDSYIATRGRLTGSRQAAYAWSVTIGLCGYSPRYVEEYVSQSVAAAEGMQRWCFDGDPDAHLAVRLAALHEHLSAEIQTHLALDVEKWTDWSVWARNHVAHGGTRRKRILESGAQLRAIAESVQLVCYLVVLHELGVPVGRMRDALYNHPRLNVMCESSKAIEQMSSQAPIEQGGD